MREIKLKAKQLLIKVGKKEGEEKKIVEAKLAGIEILEEWEAQIEKEVVEEDWTFKDLGEVKAKTITRNKKLQGYRDVLKTFK